MSKKAYTRSFALLLMLVVPLSTFPTTICTIDGICWKLSGVSGWSRNGTDTGYEHRGRSSNAGQDSNYGWFDCDNDPDHTCADCFDNFCGNINVYGATGSGGTSFMCAKATGDVGAN